MHRSSRRSRAVGGLVPALAITLALGLSAPAAVAAGLPASVRASAQQATQVPRPGQAEQAAFTRAGAEFAVPAPLLLAVSYALTRWESHGGEMSTAGGYGPMHLVAVTDARGEGSGPASAPPLHRAAALASVTDAAARRDRTANIRAGAALLAAVARAVNHGRLPAHLGGWYAAVARYGGAAETLGAQQFADDVYAILRSGASATTSDGQAVSLPAQPAVQPDRSGLSGLRLPVTAAVAAAECPTGLDCRFIPAAYAANGPGDYGNYDVARRPRDLKIDTIVIHDTEERYDRTIDLFRDPQFYASAHYVIRSSDGQVTQMVRTRNVAWQAGNWYVNMHSIGIEHEGFAAQGATWYTEALYRSSARLVRYLAARFSIPLDRAHIIGHDNVPGIAPDYVARMHWDPGPFWDWRHYLRLLDAPLRADAGVSGRVVTIAPPAPNRLPVTACSGVRVLPTAQAPASFVYLRTAPSPTAPLLSDPALHPDGSPGTTSICDTGDKAATGQRFAVAERRGDWTAIWYAGTKAWLHDAGATLPTRGTTVIAKPGRTSVPVYGRAYPEAAAYAGTAVPVQSAIPLQYRIVAGQHYAVGDRVRSTYYYSSTIDGSAPGDRTVIQGSDEYYLIYLGHRMAYVRTVDVVAG